MAYGSKANTAPVYNYTNLDDPLANHYGQGGAVSTPTSTPAPVQAITQQQNLPVTTPAPTPAPATNIPMPGGGNIGVADLAAQTVTNPSLIVNGNAGTSLTATNPTITDAQTNAGMQSNAPANGDPAALNKTAQTVGTTAQGTVPTAKDAATYDAATSADKIDQVSATAQQGTVNNNAKVNPEDFTIDTEAVGAGQGALGQALNTAATQNISNIIDTTTAAGKLLAQQLGEGNYTDSKATMKGQMDILAKEFVDPSTGTPIIPSWASGVARNVSRIAAFKGMTGTAATAAMSQALLEASLPMAQADATFFQTLTVKNLDNRQEAAINKANVLAKLDLANLDARTTAAVTNSQAFLQMDLANLDNKQQAEIVNTQARFQSILEDSKSENASRLFNAQSENETNQFYEQLSSAMEQFNASQSNQMAQFNTGETNDMSQFNGQLENSREQFYKNMQFQIDTANAKWRQTVTLTNNANSFEAAATDVKNRVGVSVEELNRLWDRADALLDYSWKAGQNDSDRKTQLALVSLKGQLDGQAADSAGMGNILGTIIGAVAGWLF